ncbi:MAG: 50S ribosomal protein L32 [Deltaproteobacteria bacterium]|nr:50S ribosomal protein L32 [Deltaproteobacteria bacterium]
MAVPKKKVSPGRKKIRRQFYALSPVGYVTCPNCLEHKRPHRVCTCGYYDGRQVVQPKTRNDATTA